MVENKTLLLSSFTLLLLLTACGAMAQTPIESNQMGTHDSYDYELWFDDRGNVGTGSMTLTGGGTFSCQWNNTENYLARAGKKYNETQTHAQIGDISVEYEANYNPDGNSYLCIYGWTVEPLVEYYIVDSWGNWRPPGGESRGTFTVDGGTYDIYVTRRTQQPSIKGTATFDQYWSVRTSKRSSGTISVSEHFKHWEDSRSMPMGNMYEVALTVEGYQSSGSAEITRNILSIDGAPIGDGDDPGDNPGDNPGDDPGDDPDYGIRDATSDIQAEEYNLTTSSTLEIIGVGGGNSGIGYIENGDAVIYKDIDFGSGASLFSVTVASEMPSNIEIRSGSASGTLLGTLTDVSTGGFDTYQEKTASISTVTGVQDIALVFSGPANVNFFTFSDNNTPINMAVRGRNNSELAVSRTDRALHISHPSLFTPDYSNVSLVNSMGKVFRLNIERSGSTLTLPISHLPHGVYMLSIGNGVVHQFVVYR